MAGGPLMPSSIYPDSNGRIYPNPHIGGTNSRVDFGYAVEASLGADSKFHLRFPLPPSLPTGTMKLVYQAIANATSGNAVINPAWASVADEENVDTITLTAEGNTTETWAAGDADVLKEGKITLDADTPVAGETIAMEITGVNASWTLAAISTWKFWIIWE